MATDLVAVPFRGDTIEVCEGDGHGWVSVRRMCDNLALDFGAQTRRLSRQRWATVAMMATVAADGKHRDTLMLRVDKVPMWLATIEVARIKSPTVAAKINLYQDEAAEVLANHFLRRPPQPAVLREGVWSRRLIMTMAEHTAFIRSHYVGAWSVVSAVANDVLVLETVLHECGLPTGGGDLPDGSVGSCWGHERRRLKRGEPLGQAPLVLPATGVERPVHVYAGSERESFEQWFQTTYLPKKLPDYLRRKPSLRCVANPVALARAADRSCRVLANQPAHLPAGLRRQLDQAAGEVRPLTG